MVDTQESVLYPLAKVQEGNFELLTVALGILTSLSTISQFSPESLKQLDVVAGLAKILPQVRDQQLSSSLLRNLPQTVKREKQASSSKLFINLAQ